MRVFSWQRSIAGVFLLAAACAANDRADAPPDSGRAAALDASINAFDASISLVDAALPWRDSGTADAGALEDASWGSDAAAVDAGAALMPCGHKGAECTMSSECGSPEVAPTNCDTCPQYYRALCAQETCTQPEVLDGADVYELNFNVDLNVPRLSSMVWMAVARGTPSGATVSCADVFQGTVDFANTCYNVLDVRYREVGQPGDSYSVLLGGFVADIDAMFLVFGYDGIRGNGTVLGVSCTEYRVGSPGSGVVRFQGEPMHRW